MKLMNENELENVCGGGKISKVIKTVSLMCLIGGAIGTGALVSYDIIKHRELERRKNPETVISQVVYVVKN